MKWIQINKYHSKIQEKRIYNFIIQMKVYEAQIR